MPPGGGERLPPVLEPAGKPRGTAVLLTGCIADVLFGETNRATAALLARAGVRVLVPPAQGCCGALALHLGADERARALARGTVATLGAEGADWVVSNAAGCGAHLRGLGHLLPGDASAAALAARTRDALELLDELGLPPPPGRLERAVTVHDPCHLAHGQGVRLPVRRLLAAVPGVRLVELEESDTCCGSAGSYNLTERAMARRLGERKLDHVARSGAEVVAAANPGCLLQIRAGAIARGLQVEVEHPLDLLAAAHGVAAVPRRQTTSPPFGDSTWPAK
jgi:glycolate oxidase iron-sulfur subunit